MITKIVHSISFSMIATLSHVSMLTVEKPAEKSKTHSGDVSLMTLHCTLKKESLNYWKNLEESLLDHKKHRQDCKHT